VGGNNSQLRDDTSGFSVATEIEATVDVGDGSELHAPRPLESCANGRGCKDNEFCLGSR
jgi:hypothetical protein